MRQIKLSRLAEMDMYEIEAQTIELFGFDQAEKLEETFQKTFGPLCDNPEIGRVRPDLSPPSSSFRSWIVMSRFLIVYQTKDDLIFIVRIINASRELHAVLEEYIEQVPIKD